jgi:hypothetical protein
MMLGSFGLVGGALYGFINSTRRLAAFRPHCYWR